MRPLPTPVEAYARNLARFRAHTPFGALLKTDLQALLRATARDAGVTMAEAMAQLREGANA